jgi:hypothetical protein
VAQLHQMLGWTFGQFEFATQDVGGGDEVGQSFTAVLLEHARVSDEAGREGPGGPPRPAQPSSSSRP